MKRTSFLFNLLAVSSLASGCALTSKGTALDVRWFDPEPAKPTLTSASSPVRARSGRELELGRVSSGINLRERIAYRDTAYEIGYYDDKRWTERPEVYVRHELARTLFEERGMRRALAGQAPVLDVEVISFEELRGAAPQARIALRIVVHDDRQSLSERTIVVDRPIANGKAPTDANFNNLVHAMAEALVAVSEQVADETETALAAAR